MTKARNARFLGKLLFDVVTKGNVLTWVKRHYTHSHTASTTAAAGLTGVAPTAAAAATKATRDPTASAG